MSDIDALVAEIHEMRVEQRETHDAVIAIETTLRVQCPNNERRIGELERRSRNGAPSRENGRKDVLRFWGTLAVALASMATAILAIVKG